jgi:hypothetical protein
VLKWRDLVEKNYFFPPKRLGIMLTAEGLILKKLCVFGAHSHGVAAVEGYQTF